MARRPTAAAGAVVAVLLAGCADAESQDGAPSAAHAGMAHVHGLGVDPADGQLLAATHHGAFRVGKDGCAEQVGPVQDFTDFTVVGEEHYLASGQPGPALTATDDEVFVATTDGTIVESADGGRTFGVRYREDA